MSDVPESLGAFLRSENSKEFIDNGQSCRIAELVKESQEEREKRLKNDSLEQDILLRGDAFHYLLGIFAAEIVIVLSLAISQGLGNIHLDELSFGLLTTGLIIQTAYMMKVAIEYLFPKKA